jgi:hypothetical protein
MSRQPGAFSFTSQQVLAPGFGQTVPSALAMDEGGDTFALWERSDQSSGHLYLHAAQRPAGGSFDSGADIGDIGVDSYKQSACIGSPSLATTSDGCLLTPSASPTGSLECGRPAPASHLTRLCRERRHWPVPDAISRERPANWAETHRSEVPSLRKRPAHPAAGLDTMAVTVSDQRGGFSWLERLTPHSCTSSRR